jgi:hypothetical protein
VEVSKATQHVIVKATSFHSPTFHQRNVPSFGLGITQVALLSYTKRLLGILYHCLQASLVQFVDAQPRKVDGAAPDSCFSTLSMNPQQKEISDIVNAAVDHFLNSDIGFVLKRRLRMRVAMSFKVLVLSLRMISKM